MINFARAAKTAADNVNAAAIAALPAGHESALETQITLYCELQRQNLVSAYRLHPEIFIDWITAVATEPALVTKLVPYIKAGIDLSI